ncbi:MAG: hypothetical protein SGI88_16440, partial [Candidatus Hydrogenedentes bacterium]|nr:hypothetical protein [Candidatus Hydrogenedentota bacterium]
LRSLRIDGKNFAALNLMGSVYRGLNRLRGAREAFMRSLELNADQPRTRQALDELDTMERENPGSTTFQGGEQGEIGATPAGPSQGGQPEAQAQIDPPQAASTETTDAVPGAPGIDSPPATP